jgi:hypothetical protein
MPAARLTDRQKAEVVEKYRRGDGAQHLAVVFGCSPNTVIRAVKAALGPEEYERLKDRRGRRPGPAPRDEPGAPAQGNLLQDADSNGSEDHRSAVAAGAVPLVAESAIAAAPASASAPAVAGAPPVAAASDAAAPPPAVAEPAAAAAGFAEKPEASHAPAGDRAGAVSAFQASPAPSEGAASMASPITASASPQPDAPTPRPLPAAPRRSVAPTADIEPDSPTDPDADGEAGPGVLAIDDADDFGEEDEDLLTDDDGEDPSLFVPVPLLDLADAQAEVHPRPLEAAELPLSAYMLVDKTVELQPRPLRDIAELGRLPDEELERRALQVYVNPRQAKRLCGRTQRVIKIPDTTILTRTAPYLLAQGISRVVIEGALFALPGS